MSSSQGAGSNDTTLTFDYSSPGARSARSPTSHTATAVRSYVTDPSGTVLGLENSSRRRSRSGESYDYDPYGKDTGTTSLSTEARDNPFRFQGFAYDTDSKTYDMQARAYRPDIARFTTPDRFEDAMGDFALQSDPLTQDRYAFGAGNPVNNIEFDGHDLHAIDDDARDKGDTHRGAQANADASAAAGNKSAKAKLTGVDPPSVGGPGGKSTGTTTPTASTPPADSDKSKKKAEDPKETFECKAMLARFGSKRHCTNETPIQDAITNYAKAKGKDFKDLYNDPPTSFSELVSVTHGAVCSVGELTPHARPRVRSAGAADDAGQGQVPAGPQRR